MAVTAYYSRPDDAITARIGGHVDDIVIIEERDVGNRAYPAPDMGLQKWSARAVCPQPFERTGLHGQVAAHVEVELRQIPIINQGCAGTDEFVEDPWKELVERLRAAQ